MMIGDGIGTDKSPERLQVALEQGCTLGDKESCIDAARALGTKPLSATDADHRRAESLYAKGGDYGAVAVLLRERLVALCAPSLPQGAGACVAGVHAVKEALDKEADYTPEERRHNLGSAVRQACTTVQMPECKEFPGVEDPEDAARNVEGLTTH